MSGKLFVSGDEAVALAVRQAKPHVIAAYPITPQTIVVERLSDFVEDGSLESEYLYVESEHSAMSACLGASAMGARAFTATSSQGIEDFMVVSYLILTTATQVTKGQGERDV